MATEIILPPQTQEPIISATTNNPAPINIHAPQIKKKAAKPKLVPKKPKVTKENKNLKETKKPKVDKIKKPHHKSEHPTWAKMMCDAIKALDEKHGSSIPAIKKYILANFKGVDEEHISTHMRRGIKSGLDSGSLAQIKGNGLSGSFKLGKGKLKNKKAVEQTKKPKSTKKTTDKKPIALKKSPKPKQVKAKPKAKTPAKKATKKPIKVKMSKTPKAAKIPKPKTHKKIIKK